MDILLWSMVVLLSLPAFVVALECLVACLPWRAPEAPSSQSRPRLAVLMPAHNESTVIADTLATIMPQLRAGDRVLVVADNCSDDTATLAQTVGAQVAQRFNEEQRGKSYALAFGMEVLREDPPEVVIIIDADCRVQAGSLDALAQAVAVFDAPAQALDIMYANEQSGVRQRIAAFAWVVKNQVRATGMARLGIPCPLMGTGMAFPWHIISRMEMATGALAEDMLLGAELVVAGHAPVFCPSACVTSEFPVSEQATHTQRQRWEHGHLSMIVEHAPALLKKVLMRADIKGLFFVLDMMVPPLALQTMLMLLGVVVAALFALLGYGSVPLQTMLLSMALFASALMLAWHRDARGVISLRQAMQIPFYIVSKLTVYVTYLFSREKDWVKTKR
jgi:cellulose synthase/poly-beta-1,6-N-acetylglucosamine synthase-like glycosyltransferase